MKTKDKKTLMAGETAELIKKLNENNNRLVQLRLDRYTKPMKNVRESKNLRKLNAMIMTQLSERENKNGKQS